MDDIDNCNPLVECPFCKKKMKGIILADHVNTVHAKKDEPISKIIPVKSDIDVVRRKFVIDENGFLINEPIMEINLSKDNSLLSRPGVTYSKSLRKSKRKLKPKTIDQPKPSATPKPLEKPKLNNSSLNRNGITNEKKSSSTVMKSLRPHKSQMVTCPICSKQKTYRGLYDHVGSVHKDFNPKIVLAKFNLEYELSQNKKIR